MNCKTKQNANFWSLSFSHSLEGQGKWQKQTGKMQAIQITRTFTPESVRLFGTENIKKSNKCKNEMYKTRYECQL